ncbi:type I restriction endonuclease subunit S [Streptococcus salivarius]|jgi:restriction modification system DNA specificity domain protein|uniref:restriction endonuclease subunit S n=1 Tax=Streptococcus salivarius TaxID=1304 RepID=UPI000C79B55E|nr:restriction endonuclease subunit S [Streptococcus salivarius]PKZ95155.1 type I restriction endonuclease subunit S [Streptococcus salivarius]
MTKNKHVPKRRFKEFESNGEWVKRKLTDFIELFSGLTYSPNDVRKSGTLVLRSSNIKNGEIVDADNVFVTPAKATSENVKPGDIIVVVRNGSRSLIGKHARVKCEKPNTVIGAFMAGMHTEHSLFVNALLDTPKFGEEIEKNMGATINQITGTMFSEMEFIIPDELEQDIIGEFFQTIDSLLSIHQHKLDKLKNLKKAYLSEMFPAGGERVPKRRFPGFEGEWEQMLLGKIGKAQSGIGFPDSEQGGKVGIPFYKVSDMNNNGNEHEMVFANNYVTLEQMSQRGWKAIHDVPAIFFAKVGAAVLLNRKRLCRVPFLMDNNTMAFSLDTSKVDTNFAKTMFETVDLTSLVQIGALPSYNTRDVESISVLVPATKEQKQIGDFFHKLDNSISLQKQKLDKLNDLKKAYLNELFV